MTVILIIAAVLALILIRAAFLPNEMVIEEEIVIRRPVTEVFGCVLLLRNHKLFNKWTMADPNVKIDYTGTDGTPGFVSAWKSEKKDVGEGEQEIIAVTKDQRIDYALRFVKPFENTAGSYIITRPADNGGTTVIWGFTGKRNYMTRIMHLLLNLKGMLAKDLRVTLTNLKRLLEK